MIESHATAQSTHGEWRDGSCRSYVGRDRREQPTAIAAPFNQVAINLTRSLRAVLFKSHYFPPRNAFSTAKSA